VTRSQKRTHSTVRVEEPVVGPTVATRTVDVVDPWPTPGYDFCCAL